jgi:hypothetical protein
MHCNPRSGIREIQCDCPLRSGARIAGTRCHQRHGMDGTPLRPQYVQQKLRDCITTPEALTGFLHVPIHYRRSQRAGFKTWPCTPPQFRQAFACAHFCVLMKTSNVQANSN